MNEKQTSETAAVRPTKKQRELLTFIENFIREHGYSPSYREIMTGLSYTSVATVSLHVNSLIKRGHLRKRDFSARSLEVVEPSEQTAKITTNQIDPADEKWLVGRIEHSFSQLEATSEVVPRQELDNLHILIAALRVLGFDGAAESFTTRLATLKKRV
ncbi:MAG: LexA family protein [Candidatus Saccharimonadales bacterium]